MTSSGQGCRSCTTCDGASPTCCRCVAAASAALVRPWDRAWSLLLGLVDASPPSAGKPQTTAGSLRQGRPEAVKALLVVECFVVGAQVVAAFQFIIEEKFLTSFQVGGRYTMLHG